MQLTIDLPDILPKEKTSSLIQKIEQMFITEGISVQIKLPTDSWDKLDNVDTEIQNFTKNHNIYSLSGTWTEQQSDEFLSILSDFSQIDKELWQ
ncbi:hypothetical protein QUF50_01370 [Thiotrichales bacterium HSG1]|nr:hypothetical protein [Thiotrichales bacterium HSG1]